MSAKSGDLFYGYEDEIKDLMSSLKRFDEDTFKILRKELTRLSTTGKRLVVANSPSRTGRMKSAWSKKSTITTNTLDVSVTIKWPPPGMKPNTEGKFVRYPFVLEHGRHGGRSKSGREITAMAPRRFLSNARAQLRPQAEATLQRIHDEAIRAFEK